MGGVSANKRFLRDKELLQIMLETNKKTLIKFIPLMVIKMVFPKKIRRILRRVNYYFSLILTNKKNV
ncbi:hypothetical protein IMA28_004786 [Salmonella enterica]|nr:hypothetical protein [Salmonella enterica]EDQ8748240.1 hypothetical protein [Salmonella enterica subsp. enterica serovar Soerenga]EDR6197259.1 hypothetical protein [Salmonella enterica subsp. enterica serovar Aqua]EBN6378928.1 hypothetical protein [Salmonella enterica]EBQ8258888.1 hypothetical protein [Salmonella enterica]